MSRSDPTVTMRSGAPPLEVRDLAVEVGGRIVVEGLDLAVRPGDKVGVVGRNGAGKTSTLRVLAGELQPASGSVVQRGAVGYLRQDPRQHRADDAATGLEHVLTARGLVDLARELEKSRLQLEESPTDRRVARFSKLEEEFRSLDGYRAEADAKAIAHGLGLPVDRLTLPVDALSGGERRRLELARILFGGSDLLLLDEPTNHLDVDAKVWLMRFLTTYRGALLVVSHDIGLLDASITRIVHLGDGPPVEYRGTYTAYRAARAQDEERLAKIAGRQDREIRRLRTLADSMRGQTAKRARVAKSLDSRRARLEADRVEGPARERKVRFRFPEPPHCGKQVLVVDGVAKGYGGPPVFRDVSFELGRGERILILGLNGAGKTSLLRIIAGLSRADEGAVHFGHEVRPGYYAQEHEGIQEGVEVLAHMKAESRADDQTLRSMLGMFGLPGEKALQDAGTLSGGEKTKLALAQLVAGRYNLLLLDEPTNNLDPPSREAVAEALRDWPGAMVIVSHDAGFVGALEPDRVLLMPDGDRDLWDDGYLDLVELA
jgi:ATPase subunit of ABC transporter with duplicated ATPase domains